MTPQRLLIVDDDEQLLYVVERLLRGVSNLAVRTCCSVDEAVKIVADWRPTLVLSDVDFGDAQPTGFDLAALVKGVVPVALMSGLVTDARRKEAAEVGAIGILLKPFSPREEVLRLLGRSTERAA
jgi:CheY-like chemotaxis protein